MPAKRKRAQTTDPTRSRILEAEKKLAPVRREQIGLDAEAYETLAVLVERGAGKQSDVLREALATGLRVMKAGSEPAAHTFGAPGDVLEIESMDDQLANGVSATTSGGLVDAMLGRAPIGAPILEPPRREPVPFEPEGDEIVE